MTKDEALAQSGRWTLEDMAYRPGALVRTEPDPTPEQLAALGWQSIECPFCGSSGAQAFPKPEMQDWEGIAADQAMTIALMKSEQEPVAKYIGECNDGSLVQLYDDVKKGTAFYTTPPQQDEQKAFKTGYDAGVLETQLDQALERNFCHRCGTRLMSALGPVSLHTCCPPKQERNWILSDKYGNPLQKRTFDDYGNKIP